MAKQTLGGHHNERLAEVAVDLATKHMEVLGRGGDIHHLPVAALDLEPGAFFHGGHNVLILIHHLQESLHTAAAVLGTLAVIAMRQQQGQTGHAVPLGFSTRQELIQNDLSEHACSNSAQRHAAKDLAYLSTVHEIAELSFPQNQLVGAFQAVAQIETHDTILRQRRIGNSECGLKQSVRRGMQCCNLKQNAHLVALELGEGSEKRIRVLIVENSVAVAESTTLSILATQPDSVACDHQTLSVSRPWKEHKSEQTTDLLAST